MRTAVVICTHNGRRFIQEQLNSIAAQISPIDELRIYDWGSSDDTVARIESWIASTPLHGPKVKLQVTNHAPGPARTWTRVFTRSRDGLPVYRSQRLTDLPFTTMEAAHSLIYVPTRRDIISSMVLIDKKAVQGLSVGQVAAYATMRGLSGEQAERLEAPGESILGLFGEGSKPAGLTRSDRIFLQTLYSTKANNPAAITLALADTRIAGNE